MKKLTITPSPHIIAPHSTTTIMRDVLIALTPAWIASMVFFGLSALFLTLFCMGSCLLLEYLSRRIMKRDQTISDLSALVTGMLLAFNLPATISPVIAFIGCFFAIVIVKQLFGGMGQNFVNPAITARVILFISFSSQMTTWVVPRFALDGVTSATPLTNMTGADTLSLFLGNVGGSLGETSALALLLGGVYLVIRRVIAPTIPLAYLGTVAVLSLAFGADPLNQLFAGGLMLGAIFMATDYTTSPFTTKGKIIFGCGAGLLTIVIRLYGNFPEGVSFAILFMNLLVPLINRATKTKPFGVVKQKKVKEPLVESLPATETAPPKEEKSVEKKSYAFLIKPTVTLACIASVIAMLLATTYQITGVGNIEPTLNDEKRAELAFVLGADNLTHAKVELDPTEFSNFVAAYTDDAGNGVAIQIKTAGYAGRSSPIELLVGISREGAITGVAVVSHSETPGLGTRITTPEYLAQFDGMTADSESADTITGATISSKAVNQGIAEAFVIFERIKGEVLS